MPQDATPKDTPLHNAVQVKSRAYPIIDHAYDVVVVGAGYTEIKAYLAQPLVALALLALVISAAIHMRIGLKEIIEDYVHGGIKIVAILLATFFAAGVGLACVVAILKISLGS